MLPTLQTGRPTDYSADFIDLEQFATLLETQLAAYPTVVSAATAVVNTLGATVLDKPAEASATADVSLANFNGMGIYFPQTLANYQTTYASASDFGTNTSWPAFLQAFLGLYANSSPPVITIVSPQSGSSVEVNPPTLQATIVPATTTGAINASTVVLTLDGTTIASSAYSFNTSTGLLTYTPASTLAVTSHTWTLTATDVAGNIAPVVTSTFRISIPTIAAGLQTFSVPRQLTSATSSPDLIFGANNYSMARWVPSQAAYSYYPDAYATFLPPDALSTLLVPVVPEPPAGLGYWVLLNTSTPLTNLPGTAVTLSSYNIQLYGATGGGANWNMIADPYDLAAVSMASTTVLTTDGSSIPFSEAITDNLTPGVIFTYVANASNASAPGSYTFDDPGAGQLVRLQGHWLKANTNFTLVVGNGTDSRARRVAAPLVRLDTPPNTWKVKLQAAVATSKYTVSDQAEFGAGLVGGESYNRLWDIAGPPKVPGGVALRSVRSGWGADNGQYVRDYAGTGTTVSWDLLLDAPAGAVTLSWPDLRALPANVELTLTDTTAGASRLLRFCSAYSFKHAGGTRSFTLTAQRRSGPGLVLSALTAEPTRGGGLEVGYTLSGLAQVQVQVQGLGGRAVATLGPLVSGQGRGQQTWDGRDANGRPVPNGTYRIEVIATTSEGELARSVRLVRIAR
jgi:hypothetical protein